MEQEISKVRSKDFQRPQLGSTHRVSVSLGVIHSWRRLTLPARLMIKVGPTASSTDPSSERTVCIRNPGSSACSNQHMSTLNRFKDGTVPGVHSTLAHFRSTIAPTSVSMITKYGTNNHHNPHTTSGHTGSCPSEAAAATRRRPRTSELIPPPPPPPSGPIVGSRRVGAQITETPTVSPLFWGGAPLTFSERHDFHSAQTLFSSWIRDYPFLFTNTRFPFSLLIIFRTERGARCFLASPLSDPVLTY